MGTLTGRCTLRRVALNAGGYDAAGRYWGQGAPLYRAEDEAGNTWETRAQGRDQAVAMFERHYPMAALAKHGYAGINAGAAGKVCVGCGVLPG